MSMARRLRRLAAAAPGELHISTPLREGDPVVWGCNRCEGSLVERPEDDKHPTCPQCGGTPCGDCIVKRQRMTN